MYALKTNINSSEKKREEQKYKEKKKWISDDWTKEQIHNDQITHLQQRAPASRFCIAIWFHGEQWSGRTTELNKLSREIANDENQYEENWLKIAANFVSGQLPTFQLKINNVIFEIADSGDLKWNETKWREKRHSAQFLDHCEMSALAHQFNYVYN